ADSDICRFKFRQMQVQSTELHKYKDEREQMQTDASDKQQQIQTDNTADSDSSRFSGNSGFRQRDNITKIVLFGTNFFFFILNLALDTM
ncbi:hypothetical protein Tco_1290473, partial [Tanacetum coccineum]